MNDIIDSIVVKTSLAPFAGEPTVMFDVTAAGIHGDGLMAQVPELKEQIDASPLKDGQFHTHLFTRAKLDRFDPLDIDFTRAFDAEVLLKGVEFRAVDKGPVLAGVEEVRCDKVHVHPASGQVFMNTVEVSNLTGQATREKDGIHALGVVLKIAEAPMTQPSSATTKPAERSATTQAVATATTAPTTAPSLASNDAGEIKINRFLVSGVDFRVEDKTVSPSLLIPLNSLDLDVRNLSSKEFTDDRPKTKFSLLVGAGKVPASQEGRLQTSGAGNDEESHSCTWNGRATISFLTGAGGWRIALYPQPSGWLKASVSSFDLASLSSTAKQYKIDLTNGVFDTAIEVPRFSGRRLDEGAFDIYIFILDLDLSEGAKWTDSADSPLGCSAQPRYYRS